MSIKPFCSAYLSFYFCMGWFIVTDHWQFWSKSITGKDTKKLKTIWLSSSMLKRFPLVLKLYTTLYFLSEVINKIFPVKKSSNLLKRSTWSSCWSTLSSKHMDCYSSRTARILSRASPFSIWSSSWARTKSLCPSSNNKWSVAYSTRNLPPTNRNKWWKRSTHRAQIPALHLLSKAHRLVLLPLLYSLSMTKNHRVRVK